ncbi:MAG: hypothetical protein IKI16_01635 [Prevotella sp.]|nr:hypothetical protein [Prevotella sp.]
MKKLLLLCLLIVGGVSSSMAQRSEDGKIKVFINLDQSLIESTDYWNNVKIQYWGDGITSGIATSSGTIELDGLTWYEFKFDASVYAGKIKFYVFDGEETGEPFGSHRTSNYESTISNDTFFKITWGSWGQYCNINKQSGRMFIYNSDNQLSIPMSTDSNTSFSTSIDNQTTTASPFHFAIAADYAYKNDGTLDWNGQQSNYYRASEKAGKVLDFNDVESYSCWRNNGENDLFNIGGYPFHYDIVFNRPTNWDDCTISVYPYFTRTLPSAAEGYATFSSTYDVIPDGNLTAVQYASEVNSSTGHITWEDFPATGIKAGNGALLTGTAGETYKFTPASSAVATGGNYLKAITSKTQLPQTSDGNTNFILTLVGTDVGFYKVNKNKSWCSAGTAYLAVPGVTSARDFFALDGETTGIANVEINANDNFDANAPIYNLAGQRVGKNYKGVVIVNGKKMILK